MNRIGSKLPLWEGDKMLNIKKLRMDMGLTQQYVSLKVGISDRAYRDIENGKATPSLNSIKGLEKLFHKPYQELLSEV